jgi:hypothetical protein
MPENGAKGGFVLALDLEGTLISNAISCFPRPGLSAFLETCRARFERFVMFTFVPEERVRAIFEILIGEGAIPAWMSAIEVVEWSGDHKDLKFIEGAEVSRTFLVDDHEPCVHPDQKAQWVPIEAYASPYSEDDRELARVAAELEQRINSTPGS